VGPSFRRVRTFYISARRQPWDTRLAGAFLIRLRMDTRRKPSWSDNAQSCTRGESRVRVCRTRQSYRARINFCHALCDLAGFSEVANLDMLGLWCVTDHILLPHFSMPKTSSPAHTRGSLTEDPDALDRIAVLDRIAALDRIAVPAPIAALILAYYRSRRDLVDRLLADITAWRVSQRPSEQSANFDSYR